MARILASMAAALLLGFAVATPLTSIAAAPVSGHAVATLPDRSRAQPVTIVATEYGFDPSRLTLRAGVPYRLHLENRGTELHEFTAPAFLQSVEISTPDALNAERSEVVLLPGAQKDVYLVPRQAGRYRFVCADHDWAGMTGEILVESGGQRSPDPTASRPPADRRRRPCGSRTPAECDAPPFHRLAD